MSVETASARTFRARRSRVKGAHAIQVLPCIVPLTLHIRAKRISESRADTPRDGKVFEVMHMMCTQPFRRTAGIARTAPVTNGPQRLRFKCPRHCIIEFVESEKQPVDGLTAQFFRTCKVGWRHFEDTGTWQGRDGARQEARADPRGVFGVRHSRFFTESRIPNASS